MAILVFRVFRGEVFEEGPRTGDRGICREGEGDHRSLNWPSPTILFLSPSSTSPTGSSMTRGREYDPDSLTFDLGGVASGTLVVLDAGECTFPESDSPVPSRPGSIPTESGVLGTDLDPPV